MKISKKDIAVESFNLSLDCDKYISQYIKKCKKMKVRIKPEVIRAWNNLKNSL